jgi:hypothetical protein
MRVASNDKDKPRPALNNITARVRKRQDANRTREVGHLDEIQGVAANTLKSQRNRDVALIDWLDGRAGSLKELTSLLTRMLF